MKLLIGLSATVLFVAVLNTGGAIGLAHGRVYRVPGAAFALEALQKGYRSVGKLCGRRGCDEHTVCRVSLSVMTVIKAPWPRKNTCRFTLFLDGRLSQGWRYVNADLSGRGDRRIIQQPATNSNTFFFEIELKSRRTHNGHATLDDIFLDGPDGGRWQDAVPRAD